MKIKIYRRNQNIPLPYRQTKKSVGLDVYASEDVIVRQFETTFVPTGLTIVCPPDCFYSLYMRSGLSAKYGLTLVNGVGVIDEDFVGIDDEVMFMMTKLTHGDPVQINKGDRIGQLIFHMNIFPEIEWEEVNQSFIENLSPSRGGFGSTGV